MVFEQLISMLGSQAVFAVYLPFLLIFAIFYALLVKVKLFGENVRINVLIAFIMALYVAAYSPASVAISVWFASVFTGLGVTLVSILSIMLIVLLLLSPVWEDVTKGKDLSKIARMFVYLGIVIGFLVLLGSTYGIGSVGQIEIPGLTSADITFLILVIFTLLIIWFITSGWSPKLPSAGIIPFYK